MYVHEYIMCVKLSKKSISEIRYICHIKNQDIQKLYIKYIYVYKIRMRLCRNQNDRMQISKKCTEISKKWYVSKNHLYIIVYNFSGHCVCLIFYISGLLFSRFRMSITKIFKYDRLSLFIWEFYVNDFMTTHSSCIFRHFRIESAFFILNNFLY